MAPCNELRLLFTLLLPGVEVCVPDPLLCLSAASRGPVPFGAEACEVGGGPCDDPISRVAGGRAPLCCCLFFFPKRNDMAAGLRRGRRQGRISAPSKTHSVVAIYGCGSRARWWARGRNLSSRGAGRRAATARQRGARVSNVWRIGRGAHVFAGEISGTRAGGRRAEGRLMAEEESATVFWDGDGAGAIRQG